MKAMISRRGKSFLQYFAAHQFTRLNCFVNSRQVLINDSTCAEIKMSHFRIAHLTGGQTDILPACA